MKLTAHDWKILRLPLGIFGTVMILATLMTGFASKTQTEAFQALQTQNGQLNQARQRYLASDAEREAIVKYLPLYQQLIQQGFIGEERRLEWIDELRTINQQHKLFGITYSIGAQEAYKPPFSVNTGPFTLHRSVMEIDLALLHEYDLLTMLNTLAASRHAPFMVRNCVMTRLAGGVKNKFVPYLNSSCAIDWLTISEPQRTEVKP